ncbi:MAG: folate family ECF transporter S component [Oscillospiraceae bacterium]|nr:folate family ECF transporter S component [Oscillospiraceae bacterium]
MQQNDRLFSHPFSAAYWRLAAAEYKKPKMLVLAAMLTAMRIAVKSLSVPVGPSLKITFGFLVNAVGSMIYGPAVAVAASAVSDTLGAILFPSGTYFFPFIFEEIAGGVLFALFYYRARLSATRVMLGRLAVTAVCNLILNPLLLMWYYAVIVGKSYAFMTWPRLAKNIALFPLQTVALVLLFNLLLPVTNRMGLTYTGNSKLALTKKNVLALIALTLLAAAAVAAYYLWVYRPKA